MAALVFIINIAEMVILLAAFGSGMAAAVMIGITMNQFNGQCILNAGVEYVSSTEFRINFSSYSRCQYCLLIHIVGLLLALVFGLYRLLVACKGKFDIRLRGRLLVGVVFGVFSFLLLVGTCLATVGLKTFCAHLLADRSGICRDFQGVNWRDVNGSHFYDNLTTAEAASWISLLLWLTLTGLSLATYCILKRRAKARARAAKLQAVEQTT